MEGRIGYRMGMEQDLKKKLARDDIKDIAVGPKGRHLMRGI